MNGAEIHLLLNHLPVVLPFVGGPLFVWGWLKKSRDVQIASLIILVAAALFTLPTYFTGEAAETILKKYPGFEIQLVHLHEGAAPWALFFLELSGILSIYALWALRKGRTLKVTFAIVLGLSTLFALTSVARTAHLGGQIRHEETR